MSEPTLDSLDRKTLADFHAVLRELTQLIGEENDILAIPAEGLPPEMVRRKEELSERYARLTVALRPRASALHAAGALDPTAMEADIRALVRRVKENQALLNARKAATALRVEAVMQALADRERRESRAYSAAGEAMSLGRASASGLHLSA